MFMAQLVQLIPVMGSVTVSRGMNAHLIRRMAHGDNSRKE
jgi:hypothetical protein